MAEKGSFELIYMAVVDDGAAVLKLWYDVDEDKLIVDLIVGKEETTHDIPYKTISEVRSIIANPGSGW